MTVSSCSFVPIAGPGSKRGGCDVVALSVADVAPHGYAVAEAHWRRYFDEDNPSFQLKQRHQRDIPPRRILHDTVGPPPPSSTNSTGVPTPKTLTEYDAVALELVREHPRC
jgi:hypothetical protein